MTILCFPKVNCVCIIIVGDTNYKGGYSEMVNKIVEVLTKALVGYYERNIMRISVDSVMLIYLDTERL